MSVLTTPWAPPTVARENPYVGPRSLRHGEPIYGRRREIAEIRGLLMSRRIVLMYSPSGAGKTSLIEAGLRPELVDREFQVLPTIRVGYELDGAPGNRYVNSAVACLDDTRGAGAQGAPGRTMLDALAPSRGDGDERRLCLIFDQFEELFTLNPADVEAKHEFTRALGELLEDRTIWALFAIREDFIAQLDPYLDDVPTRWRTRVRLELLGTEAAKDAVRGPAAASGTVFEERAVDALVDDLRQIQVEQFGQTITELGPYVEPLQLQVVCRRLWSPTTAAIRAEDVALGGGVDQALAEYYETELAGAVSATGVDEAELRAWFDRELITEDGYRRQTREGPGPKGAAVLEHLDHAYLVRPERRRGTDWYELTHDRFVAPIRGSNRRFRVARAKRRSRWAFGGALVAVAVVTALVAVLVTTRTEAPPTLAAEQIGLGTSTAVTFDRGETQRYRVDDADAGVVAALVSEGSAPALATMRLLSLVDGEAGPELASAEIIGTQSASQRDRVASTDDVERSPVGRTAVVASPAGWPSTSYLLEMRSETGGTFALDVTAGPDSELVVLTDAPVHGEIASGHPLQLFGLEPSPGADALAVEVVVTPTGEDFDPVITLRDGTSTAVGHSDSTAAGQPETLVLRPPGGDQLIVEVSGFEGTTGDYSATAQWVDTAPLELGAGPLSGTLANVDDARWYAVELGEADPLVRLEVTPAADETLDPELELRDSTGSVVASIDATIAGQREVLLADVPGPGTYLVGVTVGFDDQPGAFTLSARSVDASVLAPGQNGEGQIAAGGDPVLFALDARMGEPLRLVAEPDSTLDVVLTVYGPAGTFLLTDAFGAGAPEETIMMLATGRYFVELSGFEDTEGSFTLHAAEEAGVIPLDDGEQVAGSLETPYEVDAFELTDVGVGDSAVVQVIPPADLDVYVELMTPLGNLSYDDEGPGGIERLDIPDGLNVLDIGLLVLVRSAGGLGEYQLVADTTAS